VAEIRIPKLNNNDTEYVLVDWIIGDGKPVEPGDIVVTVETSKAAEDLECAESGVLRQLSPAGATCRPGDVIGRVDAPGTAAPPNEVADSAGATSQTGPVITAPARELMRELGIAEQQVRELGIALVRKSDVEQLTGQQSAVRPGAENLRSMSPVQQAVARSVSQSHATIPAAYTVVQLTVDSALARARELGKQMRKLIGLPDFLVAAVAHVHKDFPVLYGTPAGDDLVLATQTGIGVTIDVGKGLFVPVVANAPALGLNGIVEALSELRRTAMTGSFRERDLTGANIVVTLHNDRDVIAAIPLILPGTICALALAGPRQELVLADDGTVVARTVANLGLAYDHRYVNGRDATLFLQAVKDAVEAPQRLLDTDE
jgi:2-oxoglutarate dehydrogenase E2 component (dihydrolipoamide succinyltransferase)